MTGWWLVPLSVAAVGAALAHLGARSLRREQEAQRTTAASLRTLAGASAARATGRPSERRGRPVADLRVQPQPLGFPRV
jgi:hypothetical protein